MTLLYADLKNKGAFLTQASTFLLSCWVWSPESAAASLQAIKQLLDAEDGVEELKRAVAQCEDIYRAIQEDPSHPSSLDARLTEVRQMRDLLMGAD